MALSITATFRCDEPGCKSHCAVGLYVMNWSPDRLSVDARVGQRHLPEGWSYRQGMLRCGRHPRAEGSRPPSRAETPEGMSARSCEQATDEPGVEVDRDEGDAPGESSSAPGASRWAPGASRDERD